MPELKALDIERGTAACGGDRSLHTQVVGMLAGDLAERVAALRRALIANDLVTAGRMAHKHKGACLAVGATALAERFACIDAAARSADAKRTSEQTDMLAGDAEAFLKAAVNLRT
jgi:HPt (histidine-containing phosphotransfer) domain-containing protein